MGLNKSLVAGHIVVRFDAVINGFLTVTMAPLFFEPSKSPIIQLLFSYAAYFALFITGPIGSILIGKYGDKIGRRHSLLISILGIGLPVFSIGIIPTYETIGITAPIILIFLRMIQGLFNESEYVGVLVHNYETGNKKISSSASIVSYGTIGGCLAALICWAITYQETAIWSWRIPYLVGGILCFMIFFLRKRIKETDDYIASCASNHSKIAPMKELWKNFKFEVVVANSITGCYSGLSNATVIFGNKLFQEAGYPETQCMIYTMANLVWTAVCIKIIGHFSDKFGPIKTLRSTIITIFILAFPICSFISQDLTIIKIYSYMGSLSFLTAGIISCSANYIYKLFPVRCRYSGFSISSSIGSMIGGLTPFMMLLISNFFGSNIWCVLWIYTLTIPTLLLVSSMNKKLEEQEAQNQKLLF